MAKKRKRAAKADAPTIARPTDKTGMKENVASIGSTSAKTPASKPASKPTVKPPPKREDPEGRSFWFGYQIAWAKLLVARFVIFGLLAVDSLLQISHAPRYGAGGFNVAHVPGLDDFGAGRPSFAIAQLLIAYLLVFAAVGIRTRIVLPIATALYAWLYFGSQLDSYQHHYLVALVLLIACFVPWERPAGATPSTPVRAWAVRLLLVQLGIMYLWAAISKMDPAWLDGRTLELQISGTMRSIIDDTVGIRVASRFALIVELILAVTIWSKRTWFVALPVGVAFHAGIFASGLEIGLFAVLMLGFYVLVIPDRAFAWIGEPLARMISGARGAIGRALSSWVGIGVALAMGYGLTLLIRLPFAMALGMAIAATCTVLSAYTRDRAIAAGLVGAHVFAMIVWLVVDRASTTAVDYYRFWGGNARRLGDPAASEYAYRRVIEIDPQEPAGHYQLGQILLGRGEEAAGLARLHEAQRLEPSRARAYLAEARYLQSKGRTDEALAKAQEATYAQPDHPQAQQFLRSLSGPADAKPDDTDTKAPNDND
ncbi:MAG: HTTM domain-containing protein [Kofleriaceae bacterium]